MSEPFVGEIRMFAGNYPPRGWAFCDGQLLAVSQNDALFSLLGTIYGGDGSTTFAVPDLRGRVPVHAGTGPGLSPVALGEKRGSETVTVQSTQLPSHTHPMHASNELANETQPNAAAMPAQVSGFRVYRSGAAPNTTLAPQAISSVGGNQSHNNVQPFQCVNFIIALLGIYPSRQ